MKSLILDYAIERKGEIEAIYQYDFSESLNVITIDNEKIAFIDSSYKDVCLLTKTKIMSESDDEGIDMLELKTKTDAFRERDDESNLLLELKTKTFTARERDDEGFNYN